MGKASTDNVAPNDCTQVQGLCQPARLDVRRNNSEELREEFEHLNDADTFINDRLPMRAPCVPLLPPEPKRSGANPDLQTFQPHPTGMSRVLASRCKNLADGGDSFALFNTAKPLNMYKITNYRVLFNGFSQTKFIKQQRFLVGRTSYSQTSQMMKQTKHNRKSN